MKIFIGWSGDRSKVIGAALRDWLPKVIQCLEPYFSPYDLPTGTNWSSEIAIQLDQTSVGLLCLTRENCTAPWIMFEAGALAKKIGESRVCPILYEMTEADLQGPLTLFQAVPYSRDGIEAVLRSVNSQLGSSTLSSGVLDSEFRIWWPDLDNAVIEGIAALNPPSARQIRSERDILEEILAVTRGISRTRAEEVKVSAGGGQSRGGAPTPEAGPDISSAIEAEALRKFGFFCRDLPDPDRSMPLYVMYSSSYGYGMWAIEVDTLERRGYVTIVDDDLRLTEKGKTVWLAIRSAESGHVDT